MGKALPPGFALAALLAAPLAGQPIEGASLIAFGDSITEGALPYDERNIGGYPTRLERLLDRESRSVTVSNRGRGGETTGEGLSRLPSVLAEGGDVLLLMEGTNDVTLIATGDLSAETSRANLSNMVSRGEQSGFTVVLGSIIPRGPHARVDRSNGATFAFVISIREIAYQRRTALVEGWEVLFHQTRPYSTIYYTGSDDLVGHPNAAGFDILAAAFADVLQGRDTMTPVIGEFAPNPFFQPEVQPGEDFEVTVYDFGAGLDREVSTLTLNDALVPTQGSGNPRRELLSHASDATTVTCFARLGVQALDQADPPNRLDTAVADFEVRGEVYRRSDINRDCRVDGRDVVKLGTVFGLPSSELGFDSDNDVNADGRLDGEDLARIAEDFGRTTF